jgi:hypothetical protein
MKYFTIIYLAINFLILSCNNPQKNREEYLRHNLIGEWESITKNYQIDDSINMGSSTFVNEIDIIYFTNDKIEFSDVNNSYFGYGNDGNNIVNYKIQNDSIFIDLYSNNTWKYYGFIKKIEKDTLIIKDTYLNKNGTDYIENKYIKKYYKIDSLQDFDKIVFFSSPCFGDCPHQSIILEKNGDFIFHGDGFVEPLGFFTSKINSDRASELFKRFRIANHQIQENYFEAEDDDLESISVSFIKDKKIIRKIYDYGKVSPSRMIYAYNAMSTIYKNIKLDSMSIEPPINQIRIKNIYKYSFTKKDSVLVLEHSERFYLITELLKSKIVKNQIIPIYEIDFYEVEKDKQYHKIKESSDLIKIVTDGRYYQFKYKNGDEKTFDLGYNFIEVNFGLNSFKEID